MSDVAFIAGTRAKIPGSARDSRAGDGDRAVARSCTGWTIILRTNENHKTVSASRRNPHASRVRSPISAMAERRVIS